MSTGIHTHSPARRAASRARAHYVIAADEGSLVELHALAAILPLCAAGRVFIEVPDATWIGRIEVPRRLSVTWLDRSRRSGAPGTARSCARGEALTRAVTAWADEMLCDGAEGTRVVLLAGYVSTADIVEHLTERLGVDAEAISTPAVYGLPTAR